MGHVTNIDFTVDLFGPASVSGMPSATTPPGVGRYTQNAIRKEIVRALAKEPRGVKKRLAIALGLEPDGVSNRLSGRYDFTIEQVGVIADELNAPTGWPWIPWDQGAAFDAARQAWNTKK